MQSGTNYVLKQDYADTCAPALIRRPALKSNAYITLHIYAHLILQACVPHIFLGEYDITYLIKSAFQFGKIT